jgi:hypothetical protein
VGVVLGYASFGPSQCSAMGRVGVSRHAFGALAGGRRVRKNRVTAFDSIPIAATSIARQALPLLPRCVIGIATVAV